MKAILQYAPVTVWAYDLVAVAGVSNFSQLGIGSEAFRLEIFEGMDHKLSLSRPFS